VSHNQSPVEAQKKTYTLLGPDRRPYQSLELGTLGGHKGSKIFGRLDCPSELRAIARGGYVKDRVFIADEVTAIASGYRPCGTCTPEKYREWKAAQADKRTSYCFHHASTTK